MASEVLVLGDPDLTRATEVLEAEATDFTPGNTAEGDANNDIAVITPQQELEIIAIKWMFAYNDGQIIDAVGKRPISRQVEAQVTTQDTFVDASEPGIYYSTKVVQVDGVGYEDETNGAGGSGGGETGLVSVWLGKGAFHGDVVDELGPGQTLEVHEENNHALGDFPTFKTSLQLYAREV